MSLLDHPDAQVLLADSVLTPDQVRGCQDRLTAFLQRYLPRFHRAEQRTTATLVIRGLLSGLQRKTCEPIAVEAGVPEPHAAVHGLAGDGDPCGAGLVGRPVDDDVRAAGCGNGLDLRGFDRERHDAGRVNRAQRGSRRFWRRDERFESGDGERIEIDVANEQRPRAAQHVEADVGRDERDRHRRGRPHLGRGKHRDAGPDP